MRVLYFNSRSIFSKINDLAIATQFYTPDLILICETWLNEQTPNAMLNIEGYYINSDLRKDRTDTLRGIGGGLLVYIRDGISVNEVSLSSEFSQQCTLEVLLDKDDCQKNINPTITLFYRSPNSSTENNDDFVCLLDTIKNNTLTVGDLNMPGINWSSNVSDRKGQNILDCVNKCALDQLVLFPTHNRGNVLDVAFARNGHSVFNVENIGNIGNSDHTAIVFDILTDGTPKCEDNLVRDWAKGDHNGLDSYLRNIKWNDVLNDCPPDRAWEEMDSIIQAGINRFIPFKKVKRTNKPRWLTKSAKRASNLKRRLFKEYLKDRTEDRFAKYKVAEKKCQKEIRKCRRQHERRLADNHDKSGFNSYVKSKQKQKESVGPLKVNGTTVRDDMEMCSVFNEYFCSVFTREDLNNIPECPNQNNGGSIHSATFTPKRVLECIKSIKPTTSRGPSGYTNKFLRDYCEALCFPSRYSFKYRSLIMWSQVFGKLPT